MDIDRARKALRAFAKESKARVLSSFFKTGPGEYGAGDIFIGVRVPEIRSVAKDFGDMPLEAIPELLRSKIHEERLLGLILLAQRYKQDPASRERVYTMYLAHTAYINNWDLVDVTVEHIVGAYLDDKDKKPLYVLARSASLWERRIAVVATHYYIKQGRFQDTVAIAKILLADRQDLIHKAVGWMLREIGKRDVRVLEAFLKKNYSRMPRTMLRYAIERFPERKRQGYLKGKI